MVGKSLMCISSTTSNNNNAKNNVNPNNDYHLLSILGSWDDNDSLNYVRGQLYKFFHLNNNRNESIYCHSYIGIWNIIKL